MKVGYKTHIGMMRDHNEDSLLVIDEFYPEVCVLAVADGMGGHNAGEVASSMAIQGLQECFQYHQSGDKITGLNFIEEQMKSLIKSINARIIEKSQTDIALSGMGTTLTLVVSYKDDIHISHIGDSRVYKIDNNGMKQLTEDHSFVADLVKNGEITKTEAQNHPQKNIITRALGTDTEVYADTYRYKLQPNDIILLCTDGLTNSLSEEQIYTIVKEKEDSNFQQIAERLIQLSNNNGGKDNITVIIFQR